MVQLRRGVFEKLVAVVCDSDFSEDDYDLNSNIAELLQEVLENASTDLVRKDNITKLFAALMLPLSRPAVQSYLKLPLLVSKLVSFSSKAKIPIQYGLVSEDLHKSVKAIGDYLKEVVKPSPGDPGQATGTRLTSRKTLQIFEILECLISTEDAFVFEVLAKHRVIVPMMVSPSLLELLRAVPLEQPDTRQDCRHRGASDQGRRRNAGCRRGTVS